ncbi:MAG: zinc ribbon domain-containing protein [Promethearchaeota archaeon]
MKQYIWLFPLLSGIIGIIGIITPVASFFSYYNIWLWGLIEIGVYYDFIMDPFILYFGIMNAIVIGIFSIFYIISGYLYKKGHFNNRIIGISWIITGISIIIPLIIYLILLDHYDHGGLFFFGIWGFFDAGFGTIGPILESILISGTGIAVLNIERKHRERHPPIKLPKYIPKEMCPYCGKPISINAQFCSKCGKDILES